MSAHDYSKLKALLEAQETFPHRYVHKFIGRNSPRFAQSVEAFQARFPKLELQHARLSKGEAHLALTFHLVAESADEIIAVLEATADIEDLHLVL